MRPGIGQNASCALGDYLTSRPKGCSRPRELWLSIYSCTCILQAHLYSTHSVIIIEELSVAITTPSEVDMLAGWVLAATPINTYIYTFASYSMYITDLAAYM